MSRKTPALTLLVALSLPVHPVDQARAGAAPVEPVATAVAVLTAWDARRAEAWAAGAASMLRPLYTRDSVAGRRDRAMLRAWAARGLAVRDLRTQLLAVRELCRTPTTWRLLVTDRVAGGTAAGPGGAWPLPRDAVTTRVVTLRWAGGAWRVASVLPRSG